MKFPFFFKFSSPPLLSLSQLPDENLHSLPPLVMDPHVTQLRGDADSASGGNTAAEARPDNYGSSDANTYAMSGRILLIAIIILFLVVVILFAFHIYARWYLLRARRRYLRNRRSRRANIVLHADGAAGNGGLDSRVLDSLPIFTFSAKAHPDSVPECAVCLSEFEENESGRILPKCNHRFHIDCIDMWFHSHSTCPLCRTTVEGHEPENLGDVALRIPDPVVNGSESAVVSESCTVGENRDPVGTSSSVSPMKLSIDVPMRRGQNFEGDTSGLVSGTSQSFRSPMTRMLSFRRMLSRERRQTPCASPRNAGNCGPDVERGVEENRLTQ